MGSTLFRSRYGRESACGSRSISRTYPGECVPIPDPEMIELVPAEGKGVQDEPKIRDDRSVPTIGACRSHRHIRL